MKQTITLSFLYSTPFSAHNRVEHPYWKTKIPLYLVADWSLARRPYTIRQLESATMATYTPHALWNRSHSPSILKCVWLSSEAALNYMTLLLFSRLIRFGILFGSHSKKRLVELYACAFKVGFSAHFRSAHTILVWIDDGTVSARSSMPMNRQNADKHLHLAIVYWAKIAVNQPNAMSRSMERVDNNKLQNWIISHC